MSIYEDAAKTNEIRDKNRAYSESTKGFRHINDRHYDDLTYKVLQHFEADGMRPFFEENVDSLGDNILQSPIERAVFAFMLISDFGIGVETDEVYVVLPGEHLPPALSKKKSVAICPQHQVEGYFLDFGIFINSGDFLLAFDFECDGLEFHGSTNRQISHDYKRDIVISKEKFQIFRCSGSDVNRHPLYEVEKFSEEVKLQIEGLRDSIR